MKTIITQNLFRKLDEQLSSGYGKTLIKTAERKSSVPLKGIIRQRDNGWVYVNISNDVIHGLFSLIAEEGLEKPPYFGEDGVGAHISAIDEDELKDKDFKDVGKEVTFKLGPMVSVKPEGWEEMDKVYFVEVECPDLEKIRKKYNLPKTYKGKGHAWGIS